MPLPHQLLLAFVVLAIAMFIAPGPNTIMVLSSGLTYGFRRTVPPIAGVTIGVAFTVAAVGLGFGAIFVAYPALQTVLNDMGVAYLVYLAVAIARSGPPQSGEVDRRGPMTFWGAAIFQWLNVKGWGLGDGDRHHDGLCGDRPLAPQCGDPDRALPSAGRGRDLALDPVWQCAAARLDLATFNIAMALCCSPRSIRS